VPLLIGVPIDIVEAVLARLFSEGVFTLGLACMKARNEVASLAALAVNLVGLLLWAAGIGHAVIGVLLVSALEGMRR
jgi:hypothetical protein